MTGCEQCVMKYLLCTKSVAGTGMTTGACVCVCNGSWHSYIAKARSTGLRLIAVCTPQHKKHHTFSTVSSTHDIASHHTASQARNAASMLVAHSHLGMAHTAHTPVLCFNAGKENLVRCHDTVDFLSMLHHLDDPVAEDADPPELPERLAAKSLFRWEVCPLTTPLSGLFFSWTCFPLLMPFTDPPSFLLCCCPLLDGITTLTVAFCA